MKRSLFALLLLCLSTIAWAQKFTVKGTVIENDSREPAYAASVALLKAADSVSVAGIAVKDDGTFQLGTSKQGDYILRIVYMGFKTYYKALTLDKQTKTIDLGQIVLEENTRVLKDAQVTAMAAQVEVKADTFMYNADAYRLPEGASLEELVRQLPGAEVGDDGTLKINGKTVSKILVKGKEFFGNDKDMALKNLTSKMVQKIKAYDKKSDYSRITGIDDGEEETVLDLTIKKGMGEGWNVNVDAAAGKARQDKIPGETNQIKLPSPLYSFNVNASRFTDNLQLMLIASRNNINNGSGRWGGFGNASGVTTTMMTGLNVTWANDKKKGDAGFLEVGGNVRYNSRESLSLGVSNSETFLSSTTSSFRNARSRSENNNYNLNADMRLEWNPDSLTTIIARPSFSHSQSDNMSVSTNVTFNSNPYDLTDNPLGNYEDDNLFAGNEIRVNSEKRENRGEGKSNSGNISVQASRRLGRPGRSISADVNANYSKSDNESFTWSRIKYYQQTGQDRLQDRYTVTPSKSWAAQGRLSYTEPITRNLNLQLSYQYQRRFSDNDRSMYNLDSLLNRSYPTFDSGNPITEAHLYDIFTNGINPDNAFAGGIDWRSVTRDILNSQYATYEENNHNAQAMFRYTNKLENGQELRFNAGVSFRPQSTLMNYHKGGIDTTVTRTTVNWAPRVNLRWKISKVSQLRVHYNARMSQPSMTQLMEVMDDSNPLSISTGNAGLRSSWSNDVFMEYNGYRTASQTSWAIRGGYNNTKNSIATANIYDEVSGVSYTRPMNIDGNWGTWANINFNTAMGEKKYWNFSNNLSANYNYRLGYMRSNTGGALAIPMKDGRVDMDALFSQVDLSQFEASTKQTGIGDNIRINYRKSFGDDWSINFTALAGFNYNHSRSKLQPNNNQDYWSFNYGGNATIMFPWSVSLTTSVTQQSRRGFEDKEMNTNELLWNATLQKSFLKGKAATISIEWNDILHQRSNVSRTISAISRTDTYSSNINSYFMVHFIYRLKLMGGKDSRQGQGSNGREGRGGFPGGNFPGGGFPGGGFPGGRPF